VILRHADAGGRPIDNAEFCLAHGRSRVERDRTAGIRVYDNRRRSDARFRPEATKFNPHGVVHLSGSTLHYSSVSIFAIAIMDGILLNFYIHQLWQEGYSTFDSIVMGADRRFRAVMMTALVDGLGLLPAALSTRIGAQTQRPLTIVVIGRAISIALLARLFQSTLMYLVHN
jgi:hypothetical protein